MPNATARYVTWVSRGRRHHGSSSSDIAPPTLSSVTAGGQFGAFAAPQIGWNNGQNQADFAFWSVTGGADGALVSQNNSLSVPVGNSDISATAWYLQGGGGNGGGGPGVFIDAFDVTVGHFVDDDFVTVAPDAQLSANANADGFVPTASLEHIDAFAAIHAVPFGYWKQFSGPAEPIAGNDLTANAASSATVFAFYAKPPSFRLPGHIPEAWTWVSWGVTVDGGGPTGHGPVPPWTPYIRELALSFAMAEAARLARPELRSKAMQLAREQFEAAAKAVAGAMSSAKQ